jgi:hypothetical protein
MQTHLMSSNASFIEMAEEAEAQAALSDQPLVRISFEILARDYRARAEQRPAIPTLGPTAHPAGPL